MEALLEVFHNSQVKGKEVTRATAVGLVMDTRAIL